MHPFFVDVIICFKPWQWQCGAVAVFLAWINLILFLRKFPQFGIYIVMFTGRCSNLVMVNLIALFWFNNKLMKCITNFW